MQTGFGNHLSKEYWMNVVMAFILVALAIFIWLRNTMWASSSEDTLPILIALPLFAYLGSPWNFNVKGWQESPTPLSDQEPKSTPVIETKWIIFAAILFVVGIGIDLTFLLALGWVLLLWGWLSTHIPPVNLSSLKKLLVLPLISFPWITLDGERIGWYFRLSGAYATAKFYDLLGYNVKLEGTNILINGLPISVEAACSGINTLQSMLIAGVVAAYLMLGNSNRFWWNIPLIIAIAWLANTLRIITLSFAALAVSREFALGSFHMIGGWFILIIMFALCWSIFAIQEKKEET